MTDRDADRRTVILGRLKQLSALEKECADRSERLSENPFGRPPEDFDYVWDKHDDVWAERDRLNKELAELNK